MGGRSRAAAQLLAGEGFSDVYNMKGGIKAWKGLTALGPPDMGMSLLSGGESAIEIIGIAYGMEEGLGRVYHRMVEITRNPEAAETFQRLAGYEDKHKTRLFSLYQSLEPEGDEQTLIKSVANHPLVEGGFAPEAFLKEHGDEIETVPDILNVAMTLEAQAMDLYHRYAQALESRDAKTILYDIAEEEKGHLKRLGQLMDAQS